MARLFCQVMLSLATANCGTSAPVIGTPVASAPGPGCWPIELPWFSSISKSVRPRFHSFGGYVMQILRSGMSVTRPPPALARGGRARVPRLPADHAVGSWSGQFRGRDASALRRSTRFEPIPASQRLRLVRSRRWRRSCRELLFNQFSEGQLCAAGRARIELLPHQLEPAIALARGDGCRVLLADEVGLGKTIQAGLAIAELRARGAAERVLIVTPAGLREQWAGELSRTLRSPRLTSSIFELSPAASPRCPTASIRGRPGRSRSSRWTTSSARTSCQPSPRARWDVIVVDEAHGLAGDSDRHEAVAALAARAPYVVLLTATPHNGDARAFNPCAPSAANPIGSWCFAGPATLSGKPPRAACIACCCARTARRSRCSAARDVRPRRARGAWRPRPRRLARAGRSSQAGVLGRARDAADDSAASRQPGAGAGSRRAVPAAARRHGRIRHRRRSAGMAAGYDLA